MQHLFSTYETDNGEFVGASAIEISTIPYIQILNDGFSSNADIERNIRHGFRNILFEVYQNYRSVISQNASAELSVELLWVTEPVENQPYLAKIRLFLIARAIDSSEARMIQSINRILTTCKAGLRLNKYTVSENILNEIEDAMSRIPQDSIQSIVRVERIDSMQNQLLSQCYSFDRFGASAPDMGAIVNCLIEHPNTVVSIQLTPTLLTKEEHMAITQLAQVLDTLSKGVMTQGVGNVSVTAAESVSSVYRYYQENVNSPLFLYGIMVYGDADAVEDVSSKLCGYLTYDTTNAPALKVVKIPTEQLRPANCFTALPWITSELLLRTGRNSEIWNNYREFANLSRLPYVITAEEASDVFRLPIGTQRLSAGLTVNFSDSSSKTYSNDLINSGDIEIGLLKASSKEDRIGISLKDLTKHMLVVGTPGSGKTTFSIGVLDRLWKQHRIPFLVIEPAKNEYRALVQSIPDIQVFTPGKNYISPFVFNPFIPPKNVKLETYKSTLKTAFAAAVSMSTPLDKIFEESLNNCYSDHRWLDTYTSDDMGRNFNISEFIQCFQKTFDEIGYTGITAVLVIGLWAICIPIRSSGRKSRRGLPVSGRQRRQVG